MQQAKEAATAEIEKIDAARDAIKDAGLVRLGAGCIHFSDPTPAREATKDAGRVRMGAGCIQF
jgi:hypothetical protein